MHSDHRSIDMAGSTVPQALAREKRRNDTTNLLTSPGLWSLANGRFFASGQRHPQSLVDVVRISAGSLVCRWRRGRAVSPISIKRSDMQLISEKCSRI